MRLLSLGKIVATLALAAALSACLDATVDVALTSPGAARVSIVETMGADFYAMLDTEAGKDEGDGAEYCLHGRLRLDGDGSAICTQVEEGAFETLAATRRDPGLAFTPAGPNRVRISLPLALLREEIGAGEATDSEGRETIAALFAGRTLTIRFSGKSIVATNMDPADDGKSAQRVLPFLDLINGTGDLPKTLYAVVEAP
ncbi:hypothetical protein IC608_12530 [Devosia sp. PTR5]|uniref:Lipoprotein n=1 Tax=Devosia oryzisoli TaxID=2774138 RepID=A0A927FUL4_9HYPH|nr:hypothetical protein [Devosia oryzisoli]MBD8066296.1 hypothetical protein [Devosia oryzisoli]